LDAFLNRLCDAIESDLKKFAPPKDVTDADIRRIEQWRETPIEAE
jgi:hypothetical protein